MIDWTADELKLLIDMETHILLPVDLVEKLRILVCVVDKYDLCAEYDMINMQNIRNELSQHWRGF